MTRAARLILMVAVVSLAGCGWTDNQKEGVKIAVTRGFTKGLEGSGKTVDPEVLDDWGQCVADKVAKRWKSFDAFKADQGNPDMDKFRQQCADKTGLFEAVTETK